ncbi:MAG TPA: hypothetical protein PKX39_03295, partial [Flavobacteriales bacterium]|nr:hypothetical protein [Flavobacteriales bacterium]
MRNALAPVLLLATCTQAADLLVAPGGGGNMYPTISAAIAAAAPNDRILIAPQVFNEDVTINKALELVSNSSTGRYTVNRTVNLAATAPDARITISGLSAIGDLTETAPMGVGAMVTMVGCRLSRVEMLMGQGRMALYRDSIFGEVVILRGDVIGCYVSGTPDSGGILITGGSMSTETNRVIGNDIGAAMTNTSFWPIMIQPCAPFICENNLLRINMTNSSSFPLFVPNAPTPSTMPCTIRNNTFRYPDHPNAYFIKIEQSAPSFTLDIRNNLFVGPVPIDPIDVVPGSSTTEAYNVLSF